MALILLVAISFSPVVEARDFGTIYRECGLGAMIAGDIPWLAIVINITWDLGTTAISSDASSPDSCKGGSAKAAAFIHDAYDSIEKDLARGNGEYLDTLMALSGCEKNVYQPLAMSIRKDFGVSVGESNYSNQTRFEKSENLYNIFYKHVDGEFVGACSNS